MIMDQLLTQNAQMSRQINGRPIDIQKLYSVHPWRHALIPTLSVSKTACAQLRSRVLSGNSMVHIKVVAFAINTVVELGFLTRKL